MEVFGEALREIGHQCPASHIDRAEAAWVHTCYYTRTAWCAYAVDGEGSCAADGLFGELIDVGCDCIFFAEAAEVLADIFAGYPEDVGFRPRFLGAG